jgi:ribosomal protein S6--L-glutamate ligase
MLEGNDGPIVMEVNSSPGLEGIEGATGIDVAGAIVELIEDEVLFPEVDLRQRLTLQRGYSVMEVPITKASELCGQTVAGSGLRDRDVIVLTIQRGGVTIPNPRPDREILAGDILLCFGKSLTLKGLTPTAKRRPKRSKAPATPAADAQD